MAEYLCISEKPTAAKRIAAALDEKGKPKKLPVPRNFGKVPVWESTRNGDKIITIPALGHLYSTVEDSARGWHYPAFSYKWVPSYLSDEKNKTRPFILAFKKYGKEISNVIVATDYDLEGEVIGATIAKFACGQQLSNVKRMRFSTLTKNDIINSFENLDPTVDINLANAGFARHEIDWLFGINLTRALTLSIKHATGRYKLVTTGRVQGPTLRFVADRERAIQTFVPIPRWAIEAKIDLDGDEISLEYNKKFLPSFVEAEKVVKDTTGKEGAVKDIGSRKITQKPPVPFNLGTLQSEAYRFFGYTPSRTLRAAEALYLSALISYPRTSSQQFSSAIKHKQILTQLAKSDAYRIRANKLLAKSKLKPTFGKKKDPAHPPIHPTGKKLAGNFRNEEKNIYNLIVCRYLAIFGEPSIKNGLRLDIDINSHIFYLRGMKVLKKGWLEFYSPFGRVDETELPDLAIGDKISLAYIDHKQS